MILNTGEYVHIIHRQLFPDDARRHFVGTVESHEGPMTDGSINEFDNNVLGLNVVNFLAHGVSPICGSTISASTVSTPGTEDSSCCICCSMSGPMGHPMVVRV